MAQACAGVSVRGDVGTESHLFSFAPSTRPEFVLFNLISCTRERDYLPVVLSVVHYHHTR